MSCGFGVAGSFVCTYSLALLCGNIEEVLTGMVFQGGFAVGFFNLIFSGFRFDGENLIWIDGIGHIIWDLGKIFGFPS